MTTAARPTFNPARGGAQKGESDLGKLSKQYSSRDLPGHTKLKYREPGQNAPADVRSRNLRRDLEERERVAYKDRGDKRQTDRRDYKRQRIEQNLDADDPVDSSSDSDDSTDSEDDTADLLAELNRIKKERAEEAAKKELEKQDEEARIRTENILKGNPLLQLSGNSEDSFAVKRRWDDDVVFKNCARGEPDKTKKQFINDTLRSEFHKKFMDKYVK